MEWRELAYIPGFEINRQGDVRNARTGKAVSHRSVFGGLPWVQCTCPDGSKKTSQINVLLEESFGPGAAEAAGLQAPNWEKVRKSRTSSGGVRQQKGSSPISPTGKRKCTDCGKPTPNYRCDACWRKRRGFGFDNGEGSAPATDAGQMADSQAYWEAAEKAAKRRRKAPPAVPDVFTPLRPRQPLPDRQSEYLAQKQHKEITMTKTYTIPELAKLFGLPRVDVNNAKQQRNAASMPGTKNHAVREAMKKHGITWDMVVSARPGQQQQPVATPVHAKPEPGMMINQDFENAITKMEAEGAAKAGTLTPRAAFPVSDDLSSAAPDPEPAPETIDPAPSASEAQATEQVDTFGQLEAELAANEWEPETYIGVDRGSRPDRTVFTGFVPQPLSFFPLEELVYEITRRMPRAEVVLR